MDLVDIVMKIIGPVEPVGETHTDNKRLENLIALCALTSDLLDRIENVATATDDHLSSVKTAKRLAAEFLARMSDSATPAAGVQASTAPSMPDDYWLHVRGCDCAYCAWERANGGDPLKRAAEEWAANSTKCCAGKRGPYVKQKCVTCPFGAHSVAVTFGPAAPQGPCTVCAKPHAQHGTYPTCATHPYTNNGMCQYVVGARCVGAECVNGCVRGRGIAGARTDGGTSHG
jgi:hypothetical protein